MFVVLCCVRVSLSCYSIVGPGTGARVHITIFSLMFNEISHSLEDFHFNSLQGTFKGL